MAKHKKNNTKRARIVSPKTAGPQSRTEDRLEMGTLPKRPRFSTPGVKQTLVSFYESPRTPVTTQRSNETQCYSTESPCSLADLSDSPVPDQEPFESMQEDPSLLLTTPQLRHCAMASNYVEDQPIDFEFSAPQFRDFSKNTPALAKPADSWFDKRIVTPYAPGVNKESSEEEVPSPLQHTHGGRYSFEPGMQDTGTDEAENLGEVLERDRASRVSAVLQDSFLGLDEGENGEGRSSGEYFVDGNGDRYGFFDGSADEEYLVGSNEPVSVVYTTPMTGRKSVSWTIRPTGTLSTKKSTNLEEFTASNTSPVAAPTRLVRFASTRSVMESGEASEEEELGTVKAFRGKKFRCTPLRPSMLSATSTAVGETSDDSLDDDRTAVTGTPLSARACTTLTGSTTFDFDFPVQHASPLMTPRRLCKSDTPHRSVPNKPTSTFSLTIPKPFRFHTSTTTQRVSQVHSNHSTSTERRRARPKPYALAKLTARLTRRLSSHAKRCQPGATYIPLAERIQTYLNTPPRLKTEMVKSHPSEKPRGLTQPKSPCLKTKFRTKHSSQPLLTAEEREWQEFLQEPKFKAHPLKPTILKRPAPLPTVDRPTPTIPKSPAIHKSQPQVTRTSTPTPPKVPKANPIRLPKKVFVPEHHSTHTEPQPFTLRVDQIGERKRQRLAEKLERQRQQIAAARQFHATGLPTGSPDPLPKIVPHSPTRPLNIRLRTDMRGAVYQAKLKAKLLRQRKERQQRAQFQAHPLPKFEDSFIPQHSVKTLTEPKGINLHTTQRSEERKTFEEYLKAKERQQEEEKRRREEEKKLQEQEFVKQLRQQMIHHPRPIPHFPVPSPLKPSDRPLTQPLSPVIGTKRKLMEISTLAANHDENVNAMSDPMMRKIAKVRRTARRPLTRAGNAPR
ncbi:Protein tpx2 [Dispira simplex]|nr:Protein tpx2 [Dispira simplex]